MLGVVVPTIPGREESLRRTLRAYLHHTREFPGGLLIHVEKDRPTCGMAWDIGAQKFGDRCDYLHFAADDVVPHEGWWQPLKEAVDAGFCACAVVVNPDGSVQSAGMSNWYPHPVCSQDWMPVEHTLTPFMTWAQWEQVRPIPHDLHFCTDTWVSARLGVQVVVREGSVFTHHNHPVGRGAGMDIHVRNQRDRARFHQLLEEENR